MPEQNPLGSEVPISVSDWYTLTDMAFEQDEWPLWNPLQFTGAPLLANFQTAVFYPPRLIFRFFSNTHFSTTLLILLRFWLCGFNAFVCARFLQVKTPAARLFSIAYMLAGYNLLWCYYPPPDVMAWFPYLFLGTEFMLAGLYRRGFFALALGAVLTILPGHPSTFLMCCFGLFLYALFRLLAARAPIRHAVCCAGYAAAAFGLAVAVCAVQLLPFLEYLPRSELFIERFFKEGVSHYQYPLVDLCSLWGPRFLGTEFENSFWGTTNHTYLGMLYVGIPVWVGALLLLAPLRMKQSERTRVRCLLLVSVLCLYLSTNLPGVGLVHRLSELGGLRPAYFIAFATFAFPLAVAYAFQAWRHEERPLKKLTRPAAAALGLVVLLCTVFLFIESISFEYVKALHEYLDLPAYIRQQGLTALAFLGLALLVMTMCAMGRKRMRFAIPLLCVLLVADQAVGIYRLLGTTPPRHLFPETELTKHLRDLELPCRVRFDTAGIVPGYATLYGIEQLHGYDAVYPKRFKPFLDQLNGFPGTPIDSLLACPYALFEEYQGLPEGYESVRVLEGINLTKNARSMPRARLVGRVEVFDSSDAMFEFMNRPEFDPGAVVCCDVPVGINLPQTDRAPPGDARITQWGWHCVTVEADARKDCVLVLSDAYYPGWQTYVDGEPADMFPAYHLFRGVALPEGRHTVEFFYRPASFRYGLAISAFALVGGLALALSIIVKTSEAKP